VSRAEGPSSTVRKVTRLDLVAGGRHPASWNGAPLRGGYRETRPWFDGSFHHSTSQRVVTPADDDGARAHVGEGTLTQSLGRASNRWPRPEPALRGASPLDIPRGCEDGSSRMCPRVVTCCKARQAVPDGVKRGREPEVDRRLAKVKAQAKSDRSNRSVRESARGDEDLRVSWRAKASRIRVTVAPSGGRR
jgi:hypothetical protein